MDPLRPYSHNRSKSSRVIYVNTCIKRADVPGALASLACNREYILSSMASPTRTQPLLTDRIQNLPPELRTRIYGFVLDPGNPAPLVPLRSRRRVSPSPSKSNSDNTSIWPQYQAATTLLLLSRQIYLEASAIMTAAVRAYIPINGVMAFEALLTPLNDYGPNFLAPTQATILHALSSFINVHIHLHTDWRPALNPADREAHLDLNTAFIYGRLRQALIIFTSASAALTALQTVPVSSADRGPAQRHAIVHLDHHVSDWQHMVPGGTPYRLKHLLHIMGNDPHTQWDVRYYVFTGTQADDRGFWNGVLADEWEYVRGEGAKYANVRVRAEVYGELNIDIEDKKEGGDGEQNETGENENEEEGGGDEKQRVDEEEERKRDEKAVVTREITPSALGWPSWPDDVPWRVSAPRTDITVGEPLFQGPTFNGSTVRRHSKAWW
ncbi:hypothetical protein BDV95DRAFT_569457 [Massariosphaeria phaeospora]|uniref:F-box domain-containing protein n=1 Tax=Massariosphaeria phaeospora TaxID=100035 RepID=A0A7C8IGC3_9PLEO|nr:hypothetical protein BDV95DRAFT_569457 [Massariosphaeria phaeospora]